MALVESVDHVCVRYRLAPYAAALGLEIVPFERTLLARLWQYQSLHRYDAVILQRTLLSSFELRTLRKHAREIVFDFDDAIWLRDSYSTRGVSQKRQRRFANVVRSADQIVAGNDFLAAAAARHTTPDRVAVVPSCVDIGSYAPTAKSDRPPVLVWVGSSSTLKSLEAMRPTLAAIGETFPGVRLKLICDRFARFDPLPVDAVAWSAEWEAAEIAAADIGIAVMPDDDWSRGKCGVKVLQYMAAGLPVIANPVGVHRNIIDDTITGTLAATADEWIAAVRQMHDVAHRRRMGAAGRMRVENHFSIEVGTAAWRALCEPWQRRQAC